MDDPPPAANNARVHAWSSRIGKILLLLALAAAFIGHAIWGTGMPREPKYKGRRLSAWLNDMAHDSGIFFLTRDDFKAMGPDAVAWVGWAAESGHVPPPRDLYAAPSSRLARTMHDLRLRLLPPRVDEYYYERIAALRVLKGLGPDAAPALPMLTRMLNGDVSHRGFVPDMLAAIGPAAWPAFDKAWQDSNIPMRIEIMHSMDQLYSSSQGGCARGRPRMSAAEEDWMEVFFVKALGDPEQEVRFRAALSLVASQAYFPDRPMEPAAIPVLVTGLSNPTIFSKNDAALALEYLGTKAAAAIPDLLRLLDDSLAANRKLAVSILRKIDLVERRSQARLQELLADPSPQVQQAAKEALENLEQPPHP